MDLISIGGFQELTINSAHEAVGYYLEVLHFRIALDTNQRLDFGLADPERQLDLWLDSAFIYLPAWAQRFAVRPTTAQDVNAEIHVSVKDAYLYHYGKIGHTHHIVYANAIFNALYIDEKSAYSLAYRSAEGAFILDVDIDGAERVVLRRRKGVWA